MSIKPHYETYRYTSEICRAGSQSIVECRLPGNEISAVLAVHAYAVPTGCVCQDGEARYNGKLYLTVVYEDAERKICRAERGAEFSHRAEHAEITPACEGRAAFKTESVNYRREGSAIFVSVIVDADVRVFGGRQADYLYDGENLVVKRENKKIFRTVCSFSEGAIEDEFETDYASDVLMHSEGVSVGYANVEVGQITVSGEVCLNLCVLKSDLSLCSYERMIPFRIEVPSDEAMPKHAASARVQVKSVNLTAGTDEEKGKCAFKVELILTADCELFIEEELPVCEDAFSPTAFLAVKKQAQSTRALVETLRFTERVGGAAWISEPIDFSSSLQAVVLPRAEIELKKSENGGGEAEGAIFAELLIADPDGGRRKADLKLPFLFPVKYDVGCIAEAEAVACGLSVRQRREGEAEMEATLKIVVKLYRERETDYVCEVEEGEPIPEDDCAISIFAPRAGDGLWELAKQLHRPVEEVEKSNPDLKFPVKEGERIFVYRRKE